MKRSEMKQKIRDMLEGQLMELDYAEQMLTIVEAAGMLPPTITVLPDSYNRQEGKMGFDANEWEPENE